MGKNSRDLRQEIEQEIDKTADDIFQTLRSLVRIPSVVGQEGEAQEWIAALYRSLGLQVDRIIPKKEILVRHPAYFEIGIPYSDNRPNIVGILPGQDSGNP